jgi:general secretion pathway protein D
VTPTVHLWSEDSLQPDGADFISLETYINFDTIEADPLLPLNPRPNVIRRVIHNEVLVGDGQTIVMGGLRRKDTRDHKRAIPFFGEIPGFGKLFSYNEMGDESTEMIIFMTPKIIHDQCEDIERIKFEKLCHRPGDIPAFLCRLNESRECFRRRCFEQTVRIVCGRCPTQYYPAQIGCVPATMNRTDDGWCLSGDYDGR